MAYTDSLPEGTTLQIFNGDTLIFSSGGKWLHPLFEAEEFFKSYTGPKDDLKSHDTAIGKAAAVLTVRLGVKSINAELLSENAVSFINSLNENRTEKVSVKYTNLIPKLMCATESQLEHFGASENDVDQMYFLLRQRARLVQGVELELKDVSAPFGCVKNLSLKIDRGGHLLVLGENGTGKTTLLKMLAGIIQPVSGQILVDGKPVSSIEKFTIGYIPQTNETQGFDLSVEEVVSLGVKGNSKHVKETVSKALERTSCTHLAARSFSSLSGGEKQKVSLARCLAQNAKLLLLDEPTASLDTENRRMVTDILRSLTISEIPTIVVVTHDRELASMHGWDVLEIGE